MSGVCQPKDKKKPTPRFGGNDSGKWNSDPDVLLMKQVQKGDEDAFRILRERYDSRVKAYFYRLFRDRAEAEDAVQDVFLRLYRARGSYRPRASFSTWIFHIAQNVGRNLIRTRRRRPVKTGAPESHGVPVGRVLGNRARDDSPGLPLERSELAGVVRAAVAELAGRQRQALELHQFHDHTYAEVAAEMDMTPKAAKSLLYRARNQLREMLQHLSNSGD